MNKQSRARGEAKCQCGLSERQISAQCCEGLEGMHCARELRPPPAAGVSVHSCVSKRGFARAVGSQQTEQPKVTRWDEEVGTVTTAPTTEKGARCLHQN